MEKISIIIPAYNVEKYIRRCLDSILNQKYNIQLEIIVVDDGSTDKTAIILQEYKSRYPQLFKIVSKKNGGVSSARNVGLDIADGDWITFIDSDDYIVKNGLSFVIDTFLTDDIDICKFSSTTLLAHTLNSYKDDETIDGKIVFEGNSIAGFSKINPTYVWGHFYRRSSIRGLRFSENIHLAEDVEFNLHVYMRNLRIRETSTNIYRYMVTEDKGHMPRDKYNKLSRDVYKWVEQIFDNANNYLTRNDDKELKNAIDQLIATQIIPFMTRIMCSDITTEEFAEMMIRFEKKGFLPVKELGLQQKIVNFIGKYPFLLPFEKVLFRHVFYPCVLLLRKQR